MDNFVVVAGVAMVFWGFTMIAMVNIIMKDFGSIQNKAVWGVVALIPFIGWAIYFMFGSKRGVLKKLK